MNVFTRKRVGGLLLEEILRINELTNNRQQKGFDFFLRQLMQDTNVAWRAMGDRPNNIGTLNINANPANSLAERVTNAMDAVIQLGIEEGLTREGMTPEEAMNAIMASPSSPGRDAVVCSVIGQTELPNKKRNITVQDRGIGLRPSEMPHTILSLNQVFKVRDRRYIGQYGQGGSTSCAFAEATEIISRRKDHPVVGYTVIKGFEAGTRLPVYDAQTGEVQIQEIVSPSYMYVVDQTTGSPFQLPKEFLEPLTEEYLLPRGQDHLMEFEHGTLIRHFGYDIKHQFFSQSSRIPHLYKELTRLFPVPLLPFRLVNGYKDRKKARASAGDDDRLIKGAYSRLKRHIELGTGKVEQDGMFQFRLNRGSGNVRVHWFVTAHSREEDYVGQYLMRRADAGLISLNGQLHAVLPRSFVRHELGGGYIADDTVIFIFLDDLEENAKRNAITANRESLREAVSETIRAELMKVMGEKTGDFQLLNERRRKQVLESVEDRQDLTAIFRNRYQQYLREKNKRAGTTAENPRPRRIPKPHPLQVNPEHFVLLDKGPLRLYPGQTTSLAFETDMIPELFEFCVSIGTTVPGTFDLTGVNKTAARHGVQGYYRIAGVKVRDSVEVGQEASLFAVYQRNGVTLKQEVDVVIVPRPEPRMILPDVSSLNVVLIEREDPLLDLFPALLNEERIGTVVREASGGVSLYLTTFNRVIREAMESLTDGRRSPEKQAELRNRLLTEHYPQHVGFPMLDYVIAEGNDPGAITEDGDEMTTLEAITRGAAQAFASVAPHLA